ncbi:MAG: LUD domain-containing protein [Acidobacteria bacterium]|jgi:L-lactate dehydrogenase complex protein LldG|nr:LUD domain-containing protein [Acidobacteriota bacterium]
MDARQQILDSIRRALETPSHLPDEAAPETLSEATAIPELGLEEKIRLFRDEMKAVSGEYIEAASAAEAAEKIAALVREAPAAEASVSSGPLVDAVSAALSAGGIRLVKPETLEGDARKNAVAKILVGIVEAPCAVADTATLAIPLDGRSMQAYFLPEIVIALVSAKSLVANHFELFKRMPPEERKNLLLITGPSRTADIEKILILGAHGPRRLVACLMRD